MTRTHKLFRRGLGAALTTLALAISLLVAPAASAANLSLFKPGEIVSDAVFFNSSTMNESQIQTFLNSKVKSCRSGYVCVKDYKQATTTRAADSYCNGYQGAAGESAARIIQKVAQSCGINPQVLLVILEKEQGLVTHTWPSDWRYTIAMGQGCPDTAACDTRYYGFQNQMYGAARQFKLYAEGRYFTWYAPGKTWNVRYHPSASCGSTPVYIANKATAALYYYTPYQPNAASLRAGYGEGDACSSYGNRNFYSLMADWFNGGSTAGGGGDSAGGIKVDGAIATYWQARGAASGWLGTPTAAMRTWNGGWSQRFAGADVYMRAGAAQPFPTMGGTKTEYRIVGEAASGLSWPTSPVLAAGGGYYQDFVGGRIYVRPSDGVGYAIASPMNEAYEAAGNIGSWLGWPAGRAFRVGAGSQQNFAAGAIVSSPSGVTVPVPTDVMALWTRMGASTGSLGWPTGSKTPQAVGGYVAFAGGWIQRAGTALIMVKGAIGALYSATGGNTSALGAPTGAEVTVSAGRWSQAFQGGSIYSAATGTFAVTSLNAAHAQFGGVARLGFPTGAEQVSKAGSSQQFGAVTLARAAGGAAFEVRGAIGAHYVANGAVTGILGAPTSAERYVGGVWTQDFTGGKVVYGSAGTVTVTGAMYTTYRSLGGEPAVGLPAGNRVNVTGGSFQDFPAYSLYETAAGVRVSHGAIRTTYQSMRGASGTLGLPTESLLQVTGGWRQLFAGGGIFVGPTGSFVTKGALATEYVRRGAQGGALGWPTGNEEVVGGLWQQKFQNGTLVWQADGTYVVR